MFFISCKSGDLYGVTDTEDGVVEMYSVDDILSIITLVAYIPSAKAEGL